MITKLELIEYLKHTPENTNYNILYSSLYNGSNKEIVDEFIEVLSRGNLSLAALQPYLAKLYEDDKTISPDPLPPFSSGGSVPKPLTYDYMPEGYPKKAMGTATVMEEQELAFSLFAGSLYMALLTNAFEIVEGQTYIVNWDGTEYECVGFAIGENKCAFGNPYLMEAGDDTGEPFLCNYSKTEVKSGFVTLDTSASHTISVKKTEEIVTPMAEEFLPATVAKIKETANNAQSTANAAQTAADNALPLSGGVIQISSGGSVATLKLNEFVSVAGVAKRGIQIGGYGAYGNPILEVEHNDIAIYDKLSQRRIGGLNSSELFLHSKNSDKIFKITVDDTGTLSATEVT